jgi:hypothetical protein
MSRRIALLIALVAATATATATAALPATASAASRLSAAVADCNAHARLTGHYSAGQLRTALNTMPADVKEYTDCYDVIQKQLLAEIGDISGGGGDSGGGGSSFLPTPLLIVLGVLVLGAGGFGIVAIRRRGSP